MSIESLIDQYGVLVSIQTKGLGTLDAMGSEIETFFTALEQGPVLLQISGGTDSVIGGREGVQRQATMYMKGVKNITPKDRVLYGGSTWEVRSVRVPDERPTTDALCYTIVSLEEVLG